MCLKVSFPLFGECKVALGKIRPSAKTQRIGPSGIHSQRIFRSTKRRNITRDITTPAMRKAVLGSPLTSSHIKPTDSEITHIHFISRLIRICAYVSLLADNRARCRGCCPRARFKATANILLNKHSVAPNQSDYPHCGRNRRFRPGRYRCLSKLG